jgi:hypothetical protein
MPCSAQSASFPVLLDADRSVTKAWTVEGLPTTIILDKNLRPILAVNGDLNWTSAEVDGEIEEALASDPIPKALIAQRRTINDADAT